MSKELNPENFGKNLKNVLEYLEMTQLELVQKTGLTPAAISQIINGDRNPALKTVCSILNALPVSFETMCGKLK